MGQPARLLDDRLVSDGVLVEVQKGGPRTNKASRYRYTGRAHPQDVTLFKSLGIGIEDLAVAATVYQKAIEAGLGKTVEW